MSELNVPSAENSTAMKVKGVQYQVINSGHTSALSMPIFSSLVI